MPPPPKSRPPATTTNADYPILIFPPATPRGAEPFSAVAITGRCRTKERIAHAGPANFPGPVRTPRKRMAPDARKRLGKPQTLRLHTAQIAMANTLPLRGRVGAKLRGGVNFCAKQRVGPPPPGGGGGWPQRGGGGPTFVPNSGSPPPAALRRPPPSRGRWVSLFSPAGEVPSAGEAMRGSFGRLRTRWLLIRPCGPPSPRRGEEEECRAVSHCRRALSPHRHACLRLGRVGARPPSP